MAEHIVENREMQMEEVNKHGPRWISGVEPAKELLRASGTEILALECREQSARLRDLIDSYSRDPVIRSQFAVFRNLAGKAQPALFIGMGASFCSSVSGSILLQSHGKASFSVDAGEWLHYGLPICDAASLSVFLTTSGESAELVELAKKAGHRPLGLISNNPVSTCWRLIENRLPILAGPEYGNATKTYTNATAAAIILASEILGRPWLADAERTAEAFAADLDRIFSLREELERFCRGAANIEIIGRGAGYGAALMGALCIREMSGVRVAAHTGAGFRHGPILDVDASHVAVIFALGRAADLGVKLASDCNKRGGRVVLVSAADQEPGEKLFPVKMEHVVEGWEGMTSILVPQALTLAMVERAGCRLPPRFHYGLMEQ